jgi:hypothetical protein
MNIPTSNLPLFLIVVSVFFFIVLVERTSGHR